MGSRFTSNDAVENSRRLIHEDTTQNHNNGRNVTEHQRRSFDIVSNGSNSSWRRHSLSFSSRIAPQIHDEDIESEVVSQAGDIGDRQLSNSRRSGSSNGSNSSWRRHSLSFSSRIAPQIHDEDIESEVVSQAGDIGDRQLSNSRRSGSSRRLSFVESGVVPINDEPDLPTHVLSDISKVPSTTTFPPLPSEFLSPLSADAILDLREKNPTELAHPSSQYDKESKKELPLWLEYISCLVHLSVFGILGVFARYLLQKLFGPSVARVTSNQSALYVDLPSNVLGSFLMGWFGVVFKGDICHVSDSLAIGLTTGYLGSLTTFSGWNQKMLELSAEGQWVDAAVGSFLGMMIVAESIRFGVDSAKGFRWVLKKLKGSSNVDSRNNYRIDSVKKHLAVMLVLLLILTLLWCVSGVLLGRRIDGNNTNAQLWLACIVGPVGVWTRWLLARLNGQGLGSRGLYKWIPFGTLIANVSAACMMAALSTVKKEVNTKKCDIIVTGIQFGFLGCLSTVSTFIAEYHAMRQSKHPWRAYLYANLTILPSFILGTLIYSVPVWAKGL